MSGLSLSGLISLCPSFLFMSVSIRSLRSQGTSDLLDFNPHDGLHIPYFVAFFFLKGGVVICFLTAASRHSSSSLSKKISTFDFHVIRLYLGTTTLGGCDL